MIGFVRFFLSFFVVFILLSADKLYAQHALVSHPISVKVSAIEKLSKAIQYQTISSVSDSQANSQSFLTLHKYLTAAFPFVHHHLKRETINRYSLLYTWGGSNPRLKPILLSAHLDVVPVEAASVGLWQEEPFAGVVTDGYVWGRGTMDDKYRVVAILEAVERLLEKGYQPERTIYLGFGHDEEVGGYEGAGKISALLAEREIKLEAVFDEGLAVAEDVIPGVREQLALVGTAAKGNLNLKLTVKGEGGHSSVPPQDTPIEVLSRAIVQLQDNPFEPRMTPTTRETVETLADKMGGKYKFAVRHYGLFKKRILKMLSQDQATDALIRTKISPTIIEAGDKYNVLPRVATAVINIRILNGEDIHSVMEHIRQAIADDRVQIEVYGKYTPPSPVAATNTWMFEALKRTITESFPEAMVVPALFPGATDSKYYTNLTDNIYRFAPQVVDRQTAKLIHNVDERIETAVFANCIQFYVLLLQNTCGADAAKQLVKNTDGASGYFGVTGE